MKRFLIASVASAAAFAVSPVQAQDADIRAYVGGGVEVLGLDDFDDGDFNIFPDGTSNAVGRAGLEIGRWFAVEAEGAFGFGAEEGADADYDSRFAAFGRARYLTENDRFEVFGKLGYATTQISGAEFSDLEFIDASTTSLDFDGVAWGLGLAGHFGFRQQHSLRLDYTVYDFGDDPVGEFGDQIAGQSLGSQGTTLTYAYRF